MVTRRELALCAATAVVSVLLSWGGAALMELQQEPPVRSSTLDLVAMASETQEQGNTAREALAKANMAMTRARMAHEAADEVAAKVAKREALAGTFTAGGADTERTLSELERRMSNVCDILREESRSLKARYC